MNWPGSRGDCDSTETGADHSLRQSPVSSPQVPGGNPDGIAVNAATETVYVATITSSGPDLVSVFNGATCNASHTGGCGQTAATLAVGSSGNASGNSSLNLAVNQATNTIYAPNVFNTGPHHPPPYLGNRVYLINGATCDAANTTGGGQTLVRGVSRSSWVRSDRPQAPPAPRPPSWTSASNLTVGSSAVRFAGTMRQ